MEERLKRSLIMMIKLGEHAEFWREARTSKYTPEEIQQLLAQYASDGMISWYVKKVEDKNFKTLEKLLAGDTIEKRIALLPYVSKEFTEQVGQDVMERGTLVEKYNYALKTPDRKYIKTIEDQMYESNDIYMIENFACYVKGADQKRAEEYILVHGNDDQKINFLFEAKDCDKQRVYNGVEFKIRVPQYVYRYQRKDASKMYDALIKLENKELVESYFKGHENEDVSVLEEFAKTDAQKAFYAKLAQNAALQR